MLTLKWVHMYCVAWYLFRGVTPLLDMIVGKETNAHFSPVGIYSCYIIAGRTVFIPFVYRNYS